VLIAGKNVTDLDKNIMFCTRTPFVG